MKVQAERDEKSLPVSDELESDIIKIMSDCGKNITPFMKLFWDKQKRLASVHPTQRRFHPMIIRYCLSVLQDSAEACEKWRKNTFLILPSSRILSDYKNVIHPKRGFNKLIIDELKCVSDNFVGIQRYVAVCFAR